MVLRSMARFGLPVFLVVAVPAGLSFGCGGAASTQSVSVPGAVRAPVAQSTHGRIKLMGDALGDVPLTPQQRTDIEQIASEADARHAGSRAAEQDLAFAVAGEVQAGAIDRAALQPKIDAVVASLAQAQPADRAAFERLHAILAPDQRTAFVDALKARIGDRVGELRDKHPLKTWAQDLKLSDSQVSQIKDVVKNEMRTMHNAKGGASGEEHDGWHRGSKLLRAFEQDRFVIDEVAPPIDVSKRASFLADHFVAVASQVVPLLTPEQRNLAAEKLKAHATGGFGPLGG